MRRRGAKGFRYSRWDGTQSIPDFDADALLGEITDDLLYHGDLHAALRRLMQQGMEGDQGERLQGLRELLQKLRDRRREELDRHDLGGVYADIAERLDEVVAMERKGIERRERDAAQEGDRRRQEIVDQLATERREQLDQLPPDLAGRVQELQRYDFMDDAARERFEALMDELRQELLNSTFNQMQGAMANMSPEQMARMKDMLAELNEMLRQREEGGEPDFDGFMERYGDFFPDNPRTLDELLESMARSMAQMQSLLNSMTPEQRRQLQELAESLLDDLDLRWQVDALARNLQSAFPDLPWERRQNFTGEDPLGFAQAASLLDTLDDIDGLERLLQSASEPGALAEVDIERAADLLGDDAARSLERLAELAKMLEEAGLIEQKEGRLQLTPKGMKRIGQNALGDLFERLARDRFGRHETVQSGVGTESDFDTKPYEWGDPFRLDVQETVRNALRRSGPGTPVRLTPDDFEVERTELHTRAATVLMVDLSLSMPMRDNFLAAKKVTMALHSLISTRFPRDYLGIVGFSEVARELKPEDVPEVSWDFVYGTNMQHGFLLARRMLARESGTKQIIMITDGEPTAHIEPGGDVFFAYPPVARTIEETLKEVVRCTREGIRINTFMLDPSYHLREFVERMTRMNRGRAFFTTPETLGDYLLVDFIDQKREQRRAG